MLDGTDTSIPYLGLNPVSAVAMCQLMPPSSLHSYDFGVRPIKIAEHAIHVKIYHSIPLFHYTTNLRHNIGRHNDGEAPGPIF